VTSWFLNAIGMVIAAPVAVLTTGALLAGVALGVAERAFGAVSRALTREAAPDHAPNAMSTACAGGRSR
jgi:hypothetical protein